MVGLQANCSGNRCFDLSLLPSFTRFAKDHKLWMYLLIFKKYPVNKVPRSCTSTKIWAKHIWVLQYLSDHEKLTHSRTDQEFDRKVSWESVSNTPSFVFDWWTYPFMFGTMSSAPAMLWEPPTTATTSSAEKPTSPKRWRIDCTLSNGSGTRPGGDAATGGARPKKKGTRGAPGHWTRLTAPASWMLKTY